MSAAVQTLWCEVLVHALADGGITTCVVSPGSRSSPIVAALARETALSIVTIIDERAAAFYALGAARATGLPVALVCTSGTAAAHYYPALVEASLAGVPLIALTADRPPELHDCGASQTIDQRDLYGRFARAVIDLGAPVPTDHALRAVRRKITQAITLARGPCPGPIHVNIPLRKPLEPAAPSTDTERALAVVAAALRGPIAIAPPRLAPDPVALDELAHATANEPHGVIVAGALSVETPRDAVLALAARTGYPVIAEAGSQLRFGPRPDGVVFVDHFDLIPPADLPSPKLVIQIGAEPVAAAWPRWIASANAQRFVLAGHAWHDPESSARVILGALRGTDTTCTTCGAQPRDITTARGTDTTCTTSGARAAWRDRWRALEHAAARTVDTAMEAHPQSEPAMLRAAIAAMPAGAMLQVGNSLPIRVVDHACAGGDAPRAVLTQRGAAGIDGLIASAAGATRAGAPVLLVLGDVSFAHDLGGLLAARAAAAPLAILVVDNRGGQIFAGLPIARAELGAAFADHWLTPPAIDPAAVATALGARAVTALSPAGAATAVATALGTPGVTVIHAPVSVSGAHDVRRMAIELATVTEQSSRRTS